MGEPSEMCVRCIPPHLRCGIRLWVKIRWLAPPAKFRTSLRLLPIAIPEQTVLRSVLESQDDRGFGKSNCIVTAYLSAIHD